MFTYFSFTDHSCFGSPHGYVALGGVLLCRNRCEHRTPLWHVYCQISPSLWWGLKPLTPQTDLHALGPSSNTDGIQLAVSAWEGGDVRDRRRQKNNALRNPYRMCISLQTQSGRVRRCWQSYLEQKEWKELATKSEQWNGKHRLECVSGWHPPSKTPVGVLPWTCRIERKWPSR